MRRIKSVLAIAAVTVSMLSLSASPALAQGFHTDNFFNHNNDGIFFDNNGFFDHHNGFFFNTPSVFNGVAQESETGNVNENFSVDQTGSNSSQCVTPQQFGNTGSQQNAQSVLQFNSLSDGFFGDGFFGGGFGSIEPEGSTFTFAPVLSGGCDQSVEQSAAAS